MGESSNSAELTGKTVNAISEVLDSDGQVSALQFLLAEGGAVIITDWTDWTLRVDHRTEQGVPDYFWPVEDYSVKSIRVLPEGRSIAGVEDVRDEADDLVRISVDVQGVGVFTASAHADGFSWKLEDQQ
jgi:hypothetical protein